MDHAGWPEAGGRQPGHGGPVDRDVQEPDHSHTGDAAETPARATVSSSPQPISAAELLGHADRLFGLAAHLTGSRAAAEDLVQETYVRALRARDRFDPGTNLRAWLFRILHNAWIDTARAAARHAPDGGGEELPASIDDDRRLPLRGDAELDRMRGLVAKEIEGALAALPPDARTVVLLDLEGLTEAEVADVMGCAVGTVKSRLARARAALRERLADYRR